MGKEPQRIPPLRTAENGNGEKSVRKFKATSQRPLLRRNTSVSSLDSTPDDHHHDDFDGHCKLPTKHQSSRKYEPHATVTISAPVADGQYYVYHCAPDNEHRSLIGSTFQLA
jgi:hypothetical protein